MCSFIRIFITYISPQLIKLLLYTETSCHISYIHNVRGDETTTRTSNVDTHTHTQLSLDRCTNISVNKIPVPHRKYYTHHPWCEIQPNHLFMHYKLNTIDAHFPSYCFVTAGVPSSGKPYDNTTPKAGPITFLALLQDPTRIGLRVGPLDVN